MNTHCRFRLEAMLPCQTSRQRLTHLEEMFDADLGKCIMSHVHAVSRTRTKQAFTLEEVLGNHWYLNDYTIYPLNKRWPKEREVIMVTKNCAVLTIWDRQKIHAVDMVRPRHESMRTTFKG